MTPNDIRRKPALVAACTVPCLTLVVATLDSAEAARGKRSKRRIAKNLVVEARTPLGLQGTAGAGDEA